MVLAHPYVQYYFLRLVIKLQLHNPLLENVMQIYHFTTTKHIIAEDQRKRIRGIFNGKENILKSLIINILFTEIGMLDFILTIIMVIEVTVLMAKTKLILQI